MTGDEGGGSAPQVFGDPDGNLWMVKARNNPQGGCVPASEFVAGMLGSVLGAAIPRTAICDLPAELAASVKHPDGREWESGPCFGSLLLRESSPQFIPGTHEPILNARALAAVVLIDTLLGAHDGRQARACRGDGGWTVWAVDFGHDIGPGNWNRSTLDAAPDPTALEDPRDWLRYSDPTEWSELATALGAMTDAEFAQTVRAMPADWTPTQDDRDALVAYLVRRREAVVTLIRHRIEEEAKR